MKPSCNAPGNFLDVMAVQWRYNTAAAKLRPYWGRDALYLFILNSHEVERE